MTVSRRALLACVIETLDRLAATQRNLPVPLTERERADLREAARALRRLTRAPD